LVRRTADLVSAGVSYLTGLVSVPGRSAIAHSRNDSCA
jgi:hypothetical protein